MNKIQEEHAKFQYDEISVTEAIKPHFGNTILAYVPCK